MLALACVSSVSLTACSDNDEPVTEATYSWGFEKVAPSTPDFMDDKNNIESTFIYRINPLNNKRTKWKF